MIGNARLESGDTPNRLKGTPPMRQNNTGLAFAAAPITIAGRVILRLPREISDQLPARSMALADAVVAGHTFLAQLEPDGKGGHWMTLPSCVNAKPGRPLSVSLSPPEPWPEPDMPPAFTNRVTAAGLADFWATITPKAKWEWFRWLRDTKSEATREKRFGVAIDKLRKGQRRPCCFNTAACTVPEVSKGGVLMDG